MTTSMDQDVFSHMFKGNPIKFVYVCQRKIWSFLLLTEKIKMTGSGKEN